MHTPLTCSVCEADVDELVVIAGRRLCDECATLSLRDIMDDLMEAR